MCNWKNGPQKYGLVGTCGGLAASVLADPYGTPFPPGYVLTNANKTYDLGPDLWATPLATGDNTYAQSTSWPATAPYFPFGWSVEPPV